MKNSQKTEGFLFKWKCDRSIDSQIFQKQEKQELKRSVKLKNWFMLCAKFGEHDRSVRVSGGVDESNSGMQTQIVHEKRL